MYYENEHDSDVIVFLLCLWHMKDIVALRFSRVFQALNFQIAALQVIKYELIDVINTNLCT